jgi:hypothetical protein
VAQLQEKSSGILDFELQVVAWQGVGPIKKLKIIPKMVGGHVGGNQKMDCNVLCVSLRKIRVFRY